MNIYSYNKFSEGAAELGKTLGVKRIKHEGSRFKGRSDKTVINWGSSKVPDEVAKCTIINKPESVAKCSNKLTFFKAVDGKINIPPYTTDQKEAFKWLGEGATVVARTVLQGHSGEGLVIMTNDPETHVDAPLYTRYIPKVDEYRIHVFRDQIIDLQRKALRNGWTEENEGKPNWKVRNHANGFVFVREGVNPPEGAIEQALLTIKTLDLDFGAVDIVWNQKQNKAYVLEVNTAPGLEGTTIVNYAEALKNIK